MGGRIMTGAQGGARRRWRGIRVPAACAIVLLVLLAGHHPLMGLMSDPGMSRPVSGAMSFQAMGSSLPTQGIGMLPTGLVSVTSALGVAGTTGDGCCLTCWMVCPLMDATTPDRTAFLSLTSHPHPAVGPSPSISSISVLGATRAQRALARPDGHIPDARIRRALLQVYLL